MKLQPQRRLTKRIARRAERKRLLSELQIRLDMALLDAPNQRTKRARAEIRGEIRAMRALMLELQEAAS